MGNLTYTLLSGQVVNGLVKSMFELSIKFQKWAENYGLDDEQSLACWLANQPEKHLLYFKSSEEVMAIAKEGFEKIKNIQVPYLD